VFDSFRKLANILEEEGQRGYDDHVVIGGLESFLSFWRRQALSEGVQDDLVAEIAELLAGYSEQPLAKRKELVETALQLVRSAPAGKQPKTPAERPNSIETANDDNSERAAKAKAALDSPTTALRGVGNVQARRLAKLGIATVRDLLFHFPRRYEDYRALKPISKLRLGDQVSVVARVFSISTRKARSGIKVTTAILTDGTGTVRATWYNRRDLEQRLRPDTQILVYGKVGQFLGYLTFESPEWEYKSRRELETARLVPSYPLTEGLTQKRVRQLVKTALDMGLAGVDEPLPQNIREKLGLPGIRWALANMHFPRDWDTLDKARKRLAFDEFLMLQLGMLQRKRAAQLEPGTPLTVADEWISEYESGLPFKLTGAQRRTLAEIRADMAKPQPMARLLQGDVGSGKTVVALAAMLIAAWNGKQAAIMAPTEILAEQHYRTITRILKEADGRPFAQAKPDLLVGSMSPKEKSAAQERVARGETNIIVGTHALIQENVSFKSLGLVVVDEQHRFGVKQREELANKAAHPHLLVMSATPIPRTLALTVYGDLDLSVIDEMPPGRQPTRTKWVTERERERVYAFIRTEIERGHQAFVICPVIEGSEDSDMRAATEEFKHLQEEVFPDLRVGLLHGRMSGPEKEAIMKAFAAREIDILISTSVVEVGVDVPNATVMMIEGAHRFGLAQLHQFRGRVGRNDHPSYCLLMAEGASELAQKRLQAIEQESDGFRLAEVDLQIRGPGEFFGTRQSGMPDLRVARLSDLRTLETARKVAEQVLATDPELSQEEHKPLSDSLARFWSGRIPSA